MYIIRNTVLVLLLLPLMGVLVTVNAYIFFMCSDCDPFVIFSIALRNYVNLNLCGIIFSIIFLRWIKLVLASTVVFTANMFLSPVLSLFLLFSLVKNYNIEYGAIMTGNVVSVILFFSIVIFDSIYMKRYFKKILTMDNDVILARINKMKTSNVVFYLNKYKRKDHTLYNSLIAKFEEMRIKHLFVINE